MPRRLPGEIKLVQYSVLRSLIQEASSGISNDTEQVTIPRDLFTTLLKGALISKAAVDEEFYLDKYPDLRDAVRRGVIKSGAEHYYITGYFENRMPRQILVDEKFYLENNPDVSEAVRSGAVASAQEHFEFKGFREGRLPFSGFSLF